MARRLASRVTDVTTSQLLTAFAEDIGHKLQDLLSAERRRAIHMRAQELWEEAGRPEGRDLEFWLQAERQLLERDGPTVSGG
ncbi:DUF2934 domain-containing protein [Bradyrhizobium sp. 150]|uniref:DUF2934 domain-containing protein n=1 Tax=Bradyrhizobium sp. 150 TaxID=2782625 RepID=UPI002111D20C|nr:DUF2934 domain-containing protein [Bradyrhizobium sp. 150]